MKIRKHGSTVDVQINNILIDSATLVAITARLLFVDQGPYATSQHGAGYEIDPETGYFKNVGVEADYKKWLEGIKGRQVAG